MAQSQPTTSDQSLSGSSATYLQGAVDFLNWLSRNKYTRPAGIPDDVGLFKEFVDQCKVPRSMIDLLNPKIIEKDRVWVNSELRCLLRAQGIQALNVKDNR
jgi:hypothetical protein